MSKYTTELRYICEREAGFNESQGYSKIDEILSLCIPKIFDFAFPIFDENYRNVLERKILRHYYTREIGAETYGLWKHFLCTKLNEIMPYYNKLYATELYEFNPLFDVDLTIDHSLAGNRAGTDNMGGTVGDVQLHTGTITDVLDRDTTADNVRKDLYSDTPQGALTGVDNETYLTNARKIIDDDEATEDTTNTRTFNNQDSNTRTYNTVNTTGLQTTENYIEHIKGKRGNISFSKMIDEYRDIILNIDMMIIKDLSDLFLNLW